MAIKNSQHLSLLLLTTICVSTILSIRNWPISAEYGLASIVMLLLAAVLFLIPISLVCAELSSSFPNEGGVYSWIKEAFGHRLGCASVWYVWVSNLVWYPTILSFASTCILHSLSIDVEKHPLTLFLTMQVSFWLLIALNFRGIKISSMISSSFLWMGTLIPGFILIFLSLLYACSGNPLFLDFSTSNLIPNFTSVKELVFLAGLILGFCGMEMPAVHAKEVKNPMKNYPKAILYSTSIILILTILGSFSIAMVIPKENINFVTAILESMLFLLDHYNLSYLMPVFSLLIAVGAFGGICTWLTGPSKGLITAFEKTDTYDFITRKNENGAPTFILITQGIIVGCLSLVFLVMPSVSSSFWILTVLSSQLYLITYLLIFSSGFVLRIRRSKDHEGYRISKSIYPLAFICFVGIASCVFTFIIGFVPPEEVHLENTFSYVSFLVLAIGISTLPVMMLREKKQPLSPNKSAALE